MKQPNRYVTRQLPRNTFAKASLIGALEALEEQVRWLVHYYPEMWQLDGLRNLLRTIDELEEAGRWSDDSEKRKSAMAQHPSANNRDLTSSLDSHLTSPTTTTTPAPQEPSGGVVD